MTASPAKSRGNLVADLTAGVTTGVANIPDALASAVLAGANPVQGLYSLMIGTPLGAILFSSPAIINAKPRRFVRNGQVLVRDGDVIAIPNG
jgi:sulfate permease, SulP family